MNDQNDLPSEEKWIPNGAETASIRKWELEFIREKPLATPKELKDACKVAIESGEIITRLTSKYLK